MLTKGVAHQSYVLERFPRWVLGNLKGSGQCQLYFMVCTHMFGLIAVPDVGQEKMDRMEAPVYGVATKYWCLNIDLF